MIIIYNETSIPFINDELNEKFSRLSTARTARNGQIQYAGITISNSIGTEIESEVALMSFIKMTEPTTLYKGSTGVVFREKDLKPCVTHTDKPGSSNTDIFMIAIPLGGRIIKSIKDANLYGWRISGGDFIAYYSGRYTKDAGIKTPVVTLCDTESRIETDYSFVKSASSEYEYEVKIETFEGDPDEEITQFRFRQYRQLRPTKLIYVKKQDFNKLNLILNQKPHNQNIVTIVTEDSIYGEINKYVDAKYKAATLFVNSTDPALISNNNYLYDAVTDNFRAVNVLLANGSTVIIK